MYTLRFTRPLLALAEAPDAAAPRARAKTTTRLGDWYVAPMSASGRELLLCTSDRSLLSVVLPIEDLEDLPERLAVALVGVLHRLELPRTAVAREIDAMTSGDVGLAGDRAVLAAMRAIARRARAWLDAEPGPVDVAELYAHLGEYTRRTPGALSAAATAVALLTAHPSARGRRSPAGDALGQPALPPPVPTASPAVKKTAQKKR